MTMLPKHTKSMPSWLKGTGGEYFEHFIAKKLEYPLYDHTYYGKYEDEWIDMRGKSVLVLRPYNTDMYQIEKLLKLCREYGLEFFITGETDYPNNTTFSVIIAKKDGDKERRLFPHVEYMKR